MHSLPQDRIGVPYVHDDCHNVYRPVIQSDVRALRVTVGGAAVHNIHVLESEYRASTHVRVWDQAWYVLGPHSELN